jgi:hypothetical protein
MTYERERHNDAITDELHHDMLQLARRLRDHGLIDYAGCLDALADGVLLRDRIEHTHINLTAVADALVFDIDE